MKKSARRPARYAPPFDSLIANLKKERERLAAMIAELESAKKQWEELTNGTHNKRTAPGGGQDR